MSFASIRGFQAVLFESPETSAMGESSNPPQNSLKQSAVVAMTNHLDLRVLQQQSFKSHLPYMWSAPWHCQKQHLLQNQSFDHLLINQNPLLY